jgi:hypothetical protein
VVVVVEPVVEPVVLPVVELSVVEVDDVSFSSL